MNVTATRRSLVDTLLPARTLAGDVALIAGGAAVTALAAQISIPWQPVPFTLQTLAVFLCGLTLGAKRGMLAQASYLTAGAAGLPVFAEGKAGAMWLFGPTGGYLLAFVLAAGLLGWVADRGWDRKLVPLAIAMTLATATILGLGTLWLGTSIGLAKAFAVGTLPFLAIECFKAALATIALPAAWKLMRRS